MYIDDNVVVAEFHSADAFDAVEEINETFLRLTATDGVDATVACIEMERAAGDKMLKGAEEAAREAKDHGLSNGGSPTTGSANWRSRTRSRSRSSTSKGSTPERLPSTGRRRRRTLWSSTP